MLVSRQIEKLVVAIVGLFLVVTVVTTLIKQLRISSAVKNHKKVLFWVSETSPAPAITAKY
jgi:hypothetical protein